MRHRSNRPRRARRWPLRRRLRASRRPRPRTSRPLRWPPSPSPLRPLLRAPRPSRRASTTEDRRPRSASCSWS
ncbi:MAG: hypothetical protein E6I36_14860 [Chloroflexi bacterium]|nr:MAG: hypothetical protein E6I36_14860 [Chloroflexota bacterium]